MSCQVAPKSAPAGQEIATFAGTAYPCLSLHLQAEALAVFVCFVFGDRTMRQIMPNLMGCLVASCVPASLYASLPVL